MNKLIYLCIVLCFTNCSYAQEVKKDTISNKSKTDKIMKTDEEWEKVLTPEQFRITRKGGTEMGGTGKYYLHKEDGVYKCVCCNNPLFSSNAKYDSGSGWPAYYEPIDSNSVKEILDKSHGMIRTEIRCAKCDAHLGHSFNDGPQPTGIRYCINSASLDFEKED